MLCGLLWFAPRFHPLTTVSHYLWLSFQHPLCRHQGLYQSLFASLSSGIGPNTQRTLCSLRLSSGGELAAAQINHCQYLATMVPEWDLKLGVSLSCRPITVFVSRSWETATIVCRVCLSTDLTTPSAAWKWDSKWLKSSSKTSKFKGEVGGIN